MKIFVDLLNAKRISVEVSRLDTVESLKEKISQVTGLPLSVQILHISQNGVKFEAKDGSRVCLGNSFKPETVISLTYKKNNSVNSFYINAVTETGRVLTVSPEGGNFATIDNLKRQLSAMLSIPAESLFLRMVDLSRFVNKGLATLFNTLEEFCVSSGSVLYVQIHHGSKCEFNNIIYINFEIRNLLNAN